MKGIIVKKSIKAAGKTQAEAAAIVGISREHLQRLLNDDIDEAYVKKLVDAGITMMENVTESDVLQPGPGIDQWNRLLTLLERMTDMVERDNVALNAIIKTGLDEGAIRFDGNVKTNVTKKH